MFRRTSHCVCPTKSSFNVNPLKTDTIFNITASSDDFLMHSPPLPPRTIKNPFTTTTTKYPPNKSSITDWNEHHKPNCYDKRIHCNCSRPHSCPADDSQFILTPPIPPKTGTTTNTTQIKPKSQKIVFDDQLKKSDQNPNEPRKSSRHRNSEKGSNRKKSRSNSRSIVRDEKSQLTNLDIHVNKYLMKNHENGLDGKIYHKSNELCKICENNEHQKIDLTPLLVSNQPDLISDRSGNPILQSGSVIDPSAIQKPCPIKARSKWRTKFSQFWSRSSKKSSDNSSASPIANRDCLVTPENSGGKYSQDTPHRPRRSKSLHLIPDNSLSPKPSSMQTKSSVPTAADVAISKHSSIFAVISPSTTRWKRNLFCISPKSGSNNANSTGNNTGKNNSTINSGNNNNTNITSGANNNKKSDFNQSIGGVNTASNCPQRNASSSISGSRISPVHLLAKSSNNNNTSVLMTESMRREKDMSISIGGCNNTSGNNMMHGAGKNMKSSLNRQEKSDNATSKLGCGTKSRTRIHQDNLNKPSQSSNVNQPLNISSSPNQLCPCHNYHFNDNHFTCNNGYSRFCTQFPCLHNNPSCQIYNFDSNTNPDITSGCSQICGCMRNIVYFSPNHFHCCHPSNGNTVFCSSCRIPIFCTSCSYNCYNSNSKACGNKQSLCHHSTSPPPYLSRQLPPPPPPPPATAFSSSHHFPRKYRQSYSKTPPPSFHTHQHSCHDDHCYQEYSVNFNHENCQKQISSKSRTYNFNSAKGGCCCPKFHNNHCYLAPHSKCSGCGSFIYDELGSLSTHYNISGFNKNQFSNTPAADSLLEIKWRNNEQGIINQCRFFASSINNEESLGRFCHHNHCSNRLSGSCGHYSNEIKSSCCRNRDKQLKRRKSSSHSCHGSNVDPDAEDKFVQQELSRAHFSSPTNNILSSNSVHISPDLNPIISNTELSATNNNNVNNNSTINNTSSNLSTMQMANHVESNDKFEPWRKTFKENMLALRHLGWYWGPLNHLEAENLVENRPDGTFLVRDSAHDTYFLSLTFRVLGTTYHTRIEYSQGKFSFWSQPESHSATTIVEFIDKAVAHSASGKFHYFLQTSTPGQPPMEVSLLYPLSRYQIVQSLQHLARFVILSNIRKDHVSQLQLPSTLKGYLLEKQYYIDNIEAFVKLTRDAEPLIYEPSRNLINNIHFNSSNL